MGTTKKRKYEAGGWTFFFQGIKNRGAKEGTGGQFLHIDCKFTRFSNESLGKLRQKSRTNWLTQESFRGKSALGRNTDDAKGPANDDD